MNAKPKKKTNAKAKAKAKAKTTTKTTTTTKKAPVPVPKATVAVSKELEDLSLAFAQRAKADGGFPHELAASLLALASMVMADGAANAVERLRGGRLGFALDEARAILEADRRRTKTLAGIPVAAVRAAAEEMRKELAAEDQARVLRERLALAIQLAPPKNAAEVARVLAALITSERAQSLFPDLDGREYRAIADRLKRAIDRVMKALRVRKIASLDDAKKEELAAAIVTETMKTKTSRR
jgi:hypothetical protein